MTATLAPPPPSPPPAARQVTKPRHSKLRNLIPLLLVLLGVAVILYPVISTNYNNIKQQEFARDYSTQTQGISPAMLKADLDAAAEYNQRIQGIPILDPWLLDVAQDPGSEPYQDYLGQLSRTTAMARVRVPAVRIDLPVFHGTTDDVLNKGAGHLYGTSLPVGGPSSHAVLTSHTGMAEATLFDHLIDVVEGDLILVEVSGQTLAYEVDQIKVILPTQLEDLELVPGEDRLTLFTCTPYAVNTHRLLVQGHRVPYTAEMAAENPPQDPRIHLELWMWGLIAAAAVAATGAAFIIARDRRKKRSAAQASVQERAAEKP